MKIKALLLTLFGCLVVRLATAQTTLAPAQSEAWGANVGWVNAAADTTHGLVVGEYVCSGYLYSANVGWINVGSGTPANHVYYLNNSATDFGVNFLPGGGGYASLRGFAYGANVGWLSFEALGNPRVYLPTGVFSGYAYCANVGWINLGDTTSFLKTNRIVPGLDSDGDGIADAYEYQYFGNLATATATSSYLRDGTSDLQRYLAGVSPLDADAFPRITAFSLGGSGGGSVAALTFTSSPSRLYSLEYTTDLANGGAWTDSGQGMFTAGGAGSTSVSLSQSAAARRFYRVRAVRPLP